MLGLPTVLQVLALAFFILATCSEGRQQYRAHFPNGNSVPCPPGDPHCEEGQLCPGVGHESCAGGAVTPNLNSFGKDLLGEELAWTKELCEKDSDGDGFSNGHELGDPCCIWKQGADIPEWMLNWPVSHPGSKESTQLPDHDLEALCGESKALQQGGRYAEGEEQIIWDFAIKEYVIPAEETTYVDVRFNFPEEGIFYLVGAEAIVDNKERVHHYVVQSCPDSFDETLAGKPAPVSEQIVENCTATMWIWVPGEVGKQPPNVAVPVGSGVGLSGINIELHYNNPGLLMGETDASILRLYLTNKPREHEGKIIFTGGVTSLGVIPPQKTMYSSHVYQIKIDPEIAPEGAIVYGFMPHMHALGRKLWVEKLVRETSHKTGVLKRFDDLKKVEDIGRDDSWHIDYQMQKNVPYLRIQNGDYLATTCIFNSDKQETVTTGGPSSQDEMCIAFLAVYPANALVDGLRYNGPQFFNELSEEDYPNVNSFLDILKLPASIPQVPLWRQAYTSGELKCRDTKPVAAPKGRGGIYGIYLDGETPARIGAACGKNFQTAFFSFIDVIKVPRCSQDCARFVYNLLGCSLVWQSTTPSGLVLDLYPSHLESKANSWCSEAFKEVYESDKISPG